MQAIETKRSFYRIPPLATGTASMRAGSRQALRRLNRPPRGVVLRDQPQTERKRKRKTAKRRTENESLRQHVRNTRVVERPFRREVEGVKCNAIGSLDGALADPELRGNILAGFLGDAVHDEYETTKEVESSPQNFRFCDKKLKIFPGKWRSPLVNAFESLVCGSKLGDVCLLPLKRATKRGSCGPVSEPFMEHRTLPLCDIASVNDAFGGELVANQETGKPMQCVMVVRKNLADVFYRRIAVTGTQDIQDVRPFHS